MTKIVIILISLISASSFANLCPNDKIFYKFNKGLGGCFDGNTIIEENRNTEFTAYNIKHHDQAIYLELSGRVHGDVLFLYGRNFEEINIKNPNQEMNTVQLLRWDIDDENYYSVSMFSDGYSGVFIESKYKKYNHNHMMDFMRSLFFITNKE